LKTLRHISILIVLLSLFGVASTAQEKTTVMTLSAEKQFNMYKKPLLVINTERGIITIKGWQNSEIKVVLKLSAKNTNSNLARKELDYMKYSITKTYNTVYVSNQMLLPLPNQEITSVVIAEYEIYVPYETEINANNRFGNIKIEDVKGLFEGELYYSDISLKRKSGNINIVISIGDFNCTKSKLNGAVTAKHSNISINETIGRLTMVTDYGNLRMSYGPELLRFAVTSNATDINIENKLCQPLGINLNGEYCPLKIKDQCYIPDKQFLKSNATTDAEQKEWKLIYIPTNKITNLNINAKFGTINLF
jgi:hypothetical protein